MDRIDRMKDTKQEESCVTFVRGEYEGGPKRPRAAGRLALRDHGRDAVGVGDRSRPGEDLSEHHRAMQVATSGRVRRAWKDRFAGSGKQ